MREDCGLVLSVSRLSVLLRVKFGGLVYTDETRIICVLGMDAMFNSLFLFKLFS